MSPYAIEKVIYEIVYIKIVNKIKYIKIELILLNKFLSVFFLDINLALNNIEI